MTSQAAKAERVVTYFTREGVERELVAVEVDGLWTVIDARLVPGPDDGDRDERVVETRLGGTHEVAAVVADYVEQASRAGYPQVRAACLRP